MKFVFFHLLAFFVCKATYAQHIKPYLAVVKTIHGKQKGVLQKVDSNFIVLAIDTGFVKIETKSIKSVKIKVVKAAYQPKTYLTYSWDTSEYNIYRDNKWVNKAGEEEPSLEDQIYGSVGTGLINGLANIIAIPIQTINASIANYTIKNKITPEQQQSLNYFSINYQRSPQSLLALKGLK